jgi:hypothetical protein
MTDSIPTALERRLPDGRRAEVVELDGSAVARVYAPSGRLYIEQAYANLGEAIAAVTGWDGEGYLQSRRLLPLSGDAPARRR